MKDDIHYVNSAGEGCTLVPVAQGSAVLADAEALAKDEHGLTHPNLHRRVDPNQSTLTPEELSLRQYTLSVGDVDSYRTITRFIHDEDSTTSEIP